MRSDVSFPVSNTKIIAPQLLQWGSGFEEVMWLDSNAHSSTYSSFEGMLAVGAASQLRLSHQGAFAALEHYWDQHRDYIVGYLSYDLKNDVESLTSHNVDGLGFPELHFFRPLKIIQIHQGKLIFRYLEAVQGEERQDFETITQLEVASEKSLVQQSVKMHPRMDRNAYLNRTSALLQHIHRGDIYEVNFCQEFYAEDVEISPVDCYKELNKISHPPFATFLKIGEHYLLSASPERYLKKVGDQLISQPIKGTARRGGTPEEDQALKRQLEQDAKELSENVMIVDLVRNDLSKTAIPGSVQVPELCKVYTFGQVHQMISTVTAKVPKNLSPIRMLQDSFPMGSMTGAPKIAAMKLIEEYEVSKRGLYSGAVGYFTPEGDFDFNVVIRSILYNSSKKYVSFSVGSAITAMADPEKEYEECLVKAKALMQVLGNL